MKPVRLRYYILDADNKPVAVDMPTWGEFFETLSNRIVDYTEINSQIYVSTVFLGLDHRHFGDGPPILFETMVFGGPISMDQACWRYASWDDACVGHVVAVRKAREAVKKGVSNA